MALRVLIVDDNELTLELVSKILELDGYEVDVAYNASDAMNLIRSNKHDLIILDVMMPDVNGYDLCKTLRQPPFTISVPILILTAEGNDQDTFHALDCGANDLLTKPFKIDELRKHVKELILE
jgi:DNA-binding response OmpR family regulator